MFENICDLKCGSPWELHAMCFLIKLGNWGEVSWYLQKADLSKKKKIPTDKIVYVFSELNIFN